MKSNEVSTPQTTKKQKKGDEKMSDQADDILAQIATNTESQKTSGNSVLYECVKTIMKLEGGMGNNNNNNSNINNHHSSHNHNQQQSQPSSLQVLAVNILGRFLVNRDNNIRYVALNALCDAVENNSSAIQRHRNQIVDCLKDADLTIRRRSLDLVYALCNKKNVKELARDLLSYLMISSGEKEFREELTSKICLVVTTHAPNRRWHVDTIVDVMVTVGEFVQDNTINSLFILISNTPELQAYTTFKLVDLLQKKLESVWCMLLYVCVCVCVCVCVLFVVCGFV